MAYQDLREFVRALEKNDELKRIPFEVDPRLEITEFADRAVKQGGPALLFERPTGYQVPVLVNAFASTRKMEIALEVNSVEEVARRGETGWSGAALRAAHGLPGAGAGERLRVDAQDGDRPGSELGGGSGAAHRGIPGDAHARGAHRQIENAAQTGRDGRVLSQDRLQGTVPGSGAHRRLLAARLSGAAMLAGRRRALHYAAPGLLAQSRYRQAQLRHVPHAGIRRAHRRNALADPQTGRGTLSPHAATGEEAHGRRGGHRRRPGHHVLGHSAAAPRPRRNDDLRLPAAESS